MGRRWGWAAAVACCLVLGAGAALLLRDGPGPGDCPAATPRVDVAGPELVSVDRLLPSGSVGDRRRPVVEAVDGFGGPLGRVVSGRFYDDADAAPVLVPLGGRGMVTVSAAHDRGELRAVSLPSGEVRWSRSYAGGAARGGLVGDDLVVLLGSPAPALVSFDAGDGRLVRCVAVPAGGDGAAATLLTDQAGTDVVVVAGPAGSAPTLSRIDPEGGAVRWRSTLAGAADVGSVTVAGERVVVGRLGPDPVRLAEMAAAGGIDGPTLTAYSLADGGRSWSYPAARRAATSAAAVVGHDDATGLLLVLVAEGDGPLAARAAVRLVALDGSGQERWSAPLGRGFREASLWGPVVVVQGPAAGGGTVLRALSVEDGAPRWVLRSRAVPDLTGRRGFGRGVAVGATFVVPAPNGLLAVEPGSGRARRLDGEVAVDEVLPAGRHVVVRAGAALLVVAASAGGGV